MQGIYRISGSKARVEKLCQAFENGRDLVELSEHSPHDITSVLKHFLKEVSSKSLRKARTHLWSQALESSRFGFLGQPWGQLLLSCFSLLGF